MLIAACCDADTTTTVEATAFPPAGFLLPRVLDPGRYHTTTMTPLVTTEFGDGWTLLGEFPPLLILSRTVGTDRQKDFLNFVTLPATERATVAEVIRTVEGVVVGERVKGHRGPGRDRVHRRRARRGGGEVEVFAFPSDALYSQVPLDAPRFADGDRIRFTLVTVGDDTVLILAGTDRDLDYGDFITQVDEVLATTTFG